MVQSWLERLEDAVPNGIRSYSLEACYMYESDIGHFTYLCLDQKNEEDTQKNARDVVLNG